MKKKIAKLLALVLAVSLVFSGCRFVDSAWQLGRRIRRAIDGGRPEATTEAEADWSQDAGEPAESGTESPAESTVEPTAETDETAPVEDNEEFLAFTNGIYAHLLSDDTLDIHFCLVHPEAYGLSTSPARISGFDYDEESVEEYRAYLDEIEDGLTGFDYESLSDEEQLIYDSLVWFIETERSGLGLELYYEPLGPNTGLQAELPVTFAEYTFYTESDIQDYLDLCALLPDFFQELLDFEQAKKDAGLFMPDELLDDVIDQCDSFLDGREDSFLYSSFENRLNDLGITGADKDAYMEKNEDAVAAIYDAYQLLSDGLKKMGDNGIELAGISRLPKGKEYYEYLVRSNVGSDRTPDEMIELLENAIDDAIDTMMACYNEDYFVDEELDEMEYPSTDPSLIMQMLIEKSTKDYPELEDVDYRIKYVDESLRDYLSPAFYFVAPFDDSSINNIYINAEKGEEDEDIFITLAHEGYPGHLYQTNYLKDHSDYAIRQLLEPTGYSEGWAKYVEFDAYNFIDGISDTAAKLLSANAFATICIHARVDLGIHYEGWDLDDVESYVDQYFNGAREVAEWMMDYIAGDPGGYLDYAVGSAEIYELKKIAQSQGMDPRTFNEKILSGAGAPFHVIEERYFSEN